KARAEELDYEGLVIKDVSKDLKQHPNKKYTSRNLDKIDQIVIHHSATTSGSAKAYSDYHVEHNDWPGIGYHYVVEKDGQVKQTNSLDLVSYHVSGQNTRSIGICMTGHYDKQEPPAIQLENTARLIAFLQDQFDKIDQIEGHRAYANKSCPGDNIDVEQLKRIANGYRQLLV
ncbi:MAG: peptidoglycan recognition family protein, partial [Bacteroidota bacterium]